MTALLCQSVPREPAAILPTRPTPDASRSMLERLTYAPTAKHGRQNQIAYPRPHKMWRPRPFEVPTSSPRGSRSPAQGAGRRSPLSSRGSPALGCRGGRLRAPRKTGSSPCSGGDNNKASWVGLNSALVICDPCARSPTARDPVCEHFWHQMR